MRSVALSFILFSLISIILLPRQASAYRIALLPAQDLTASRSGLDIALTDQISEALLQQGFEVIPRQQIIDFLVANSIRRGGEIDSLTARRMSIQLGCEGILLATITEKSIQRQPKIGMTIILLEGDSGEQIWGTTICDHINDSQPMLGIGRLETAQQIKQHSLRMMAEQLSETIVDLPELPPALPDYRITDIDLKPTLVRQGNPVFCRVKIKFLNDGPDYLEVETSAGSTILRKSRIAHYYEGAVATNPRDGIHPIRLKIHWSDGHSELVDNLINYQVANTPPPIKMHVATGLNIEETYAFSESVVIIPQMVEKRPLDRWKLVIKDREGKTILTEGKNASLPERLEWRGTDAYNQRLETGRYTMIMQVWDIAGNENRVATKFYLQPASQQMINISQVVIEGENYLKLLPAENQLVPVEQWSLQLETPDGNSVYNKTGWELPSLVPIPQDLPVDRLICSVQSLDRLGNNVEIKTAEINLTPSHDQVAQRPRMQTEWTADF